MSQSLMAFVTPENVLWIQSTTWLAGSATETVHAVGNSCCRSTWRPMSTAPPS